jgi:hypothetical protein
MYGSAGSLPIRDLLSVSLLFRRHSGNVPRYASNAPLLSRFPLRSLLWLITPLAMQRIRV